MPSQSHRVPVAHTTTNRYESSMRTPHALREMQCYGGLHTLMFPPSAIPMESGAAINLVRVRDRKSKEFVMTQVRMTWAAERDDPLMFLAFEFLPVHPAAAGRRAAERDPFSRVGFLLAWSSPGKPPTKHFGAMSKAFSWLPTRISILKKQLERYRLYYLHDFTS